MIFRFLQYIIYKLIPYICKMYTYKATVNRWVDGDTVILDIDLGFYVTRQERIRLARINAPELNNKIPFQVRKAKHARAVAKKFCPPGSVVFLTTSKNKKDMYARYIAEITFNMINISDYLFEQGCVKKI
ncbi:thermonuclease family protein [Bacteroidota bacterium]